MPKSDPGQTSWDNLQHHQRAFWKPGKQLRRGDKAELHAPNSAALHGVCVCGGVGGAASSLRATLGMSADRFAGGCVLGHLLSSVHILQTHLKSLQQQSFQGWGK